MRLALPEIGPQFGGETLLPRNYPAWFGFRHESSLLSILPIYAERIISPRAGMIRHRYAFKERHEQLASHRRRSIPGIGRYQPQCALYTCPKKEAAKQGAHVIHFPETALSGYAPQHFPSLTHYPWDVLEAQTLAIYKAAIAHNLWIVLGSMRQLDGGLPGNCLLVISARGKREGVYVKQRLYTEEKQFYSPGAGPCVVTINGFKCGFLICYDNCYPELYDAYRRLGAGLIFHSFHNAANRRATSIKDMMLANLIVRAADNRIWISASNSSKRYSPLSACIVRPDGSMLREKGHTTALVVDDYPNAKLGWIYDNSRV